MTIINMVPLNRRRLRAKCQRKVDTQYSRGNLVAIGDGHRMSTDRDYLLGTHEEEISRLGLQHDVWRPVVLDCWKRAGITAGKHVLDIGAGPGYATVDLAEIVGPRGEVVALERSRNFVQA